MTDGIKTKDQKEAEAEIHERHRDYRIASPKDRHWSQSHIDTHAAKEGKVAEFFAQRRREREGI